MERVLIVDDEEAICRLCAYGLSRAQLDTRWTTSPTEALAMLRAESFGLLVTDIKMPDMTGIELMREAHALHPELSVLVMTAYATIDIAIDALKEGANHFIHKPFHIDELKFAVESILEQRRLVRENIRLRSLVNFIHLNEKINTIHDPQALYQLVIQTAIKETGATRGKVFHLDEKTHELKVVNETRTEGSAESPFSGDSAPSTHLFHNPPISAGVTQLPHAISVPLRANNKLKGILSLFNDSGCKFTQADVEIANVLGTQTAIALENIALLQEVEALFLETIRSLATTLDEKDPYTHGHSQRVALIARELGKRMGLSEKELEILSLSGSFHDIGKIGVPDTILQKPGRLTNEEFAIIKTHPEKGAKILGNVRRLEPVVQAVYSHHEWFNGKGYPRGLRGNEIPLMGAIICVADAFDSITTDRTYQKKRSPEEAYRIIRVNAGTQFHPDVVDALLAAPLEVENTGF